MIEFEDEKKLPILKNLLFKKRGLDLSEYKDKYIKRRIAVRLRSTKCKSIEEYIHYLQQNETEYKKLLDVIAIQVTQFFRNPQTFRLIKQKIIPELTFLKFKKHSEFIRIWSAGCASGEEPYSLAILLKEALGKDIDKFKITIFATDIDKSALNKGILGVYNKSKLAEVEPEIVNKYFSISDGEYYLKEEVKKMVFFRRQNLLQPLTFDYLDIIFCRNVLIYFSRECQERILLNFAEVLNKGGFLILGKAETLIGKSRGSFQTIDIKERIYQKD